MSRNSRIMKKPSLMLQVIIGAAAGIIVGYFSKNVGLQLEVLGTIFMNLIQMIIVPLIFPVIILAIVNISDSKSFGKVAGKSFVYFFSVTTGLIVLSVLVGKWTGIGSNFQTGNVSTESLNGIASGIDFQSFFLSIVPSNLFQAFADGNLLPIIFFGIFLGLSLVSIGEKGRPVIVFFESWSQAMFKMVDYAISFAPIGVFGFLAYDIAAYGIGNLLSLGQFVLFTYLAFMVVVLLVFPIIAWFFHVPYFALLKEISDLIVLVFTTGSSSVVLPSLIDRLKKFGVSPAVSSFVTPLGYSFNLDGACVYISLATMFIVNMYDVTLGFGEIVALVLFLTIITKGIAAVPSGAVVVLLAAATQLGLPAEGVALMVSVDFFINMGRSAVNVVGNALAPVLIAQSETAFEYEKNRNFTKEALEAEK
ncbi:dicarboxylate/amino acid:cation symporter [Carnobacterium viridans]|uniref:Proton glutamate symport protein n=1 Tax=Carnobacterium viridans TaxID=174587 RepID=A0A1H0ZC10_9LACT|nr:dicarboxylate/amino acid:cation symporter [Carnobacterium viridans]UDE94717.1 dicarboxylate/amino acid:cation symporter [Carnobacterium viridans]SDQ24721.1 proton glutamate symport protein [Carnobacterium viridans]